MNCLLTGIKLNEMKNVLFLLLLITASSCCNNPDTITYNFTNDEKALVPYQKQDVVKWQNNEGSVFNVNILEKTSQIRERSSYDCKSFEGETIEVKFNIDNSPYYLTLDKWDDSRIDLSISSNIGKGNQITFYSSINKTSSFGTVEFNGEIFENSIEINGNVPNNTLIYSKTNGIEFILFEDGTWYKRVE